MSSFKFQGVEFKRERREYIFDGIHREPSNRQAAMMMSRPKRGPLTRVPDEMVDLTGRKIGKLFIVGRVPLSTAMWRIKCDCGCEFEQPTGYIRARNASNSVCAACRSKAAREKDTAPKQKKRQKPIYDAIRSGFTIREMLPR